MHVEGYCKHSLRVSKRSCLSRGKYHSVLELKPRSKCTRSVRGRETICIGVRAWVQKHTLNFTEEKSTMFFCRTLGLLLKHGREGIDQRVAYHRSRGAKEMTSFWSFWSSVPYLWQFCANVVMDGKELSFWPTTAQRWGSDC